MGWLSLLTNKWVLIGVALIAWTVYQRDQAADKAREECQAEQLQKTITELRRQRDAAQAALEEASRQEAITERELEGLRSNLDAIQKELGEAGVATCNIPDSIIEQLRNIR